MTEPTPVSLTDGDADRSPQLADGYTRIANELLEAVIAHPFTRREYAIVFAVMRKTYGYGKKYDDMTLTQLADMTGIDLANVSRTVGALVAKDVLLKQQGRRGFVIGISKNYRRWKILLSRQPLAESANRPCHLDNPNLPIRQTQNKATKETNKRAAAPSAPASIWDLGEALLESRVYVGKLIGEFGEPAVAEALAKLSIRQPPPADPRAFIRGLLRPRTTHDDVMLADLL